YNHTAAEGGLINFVTEALKPGLTAKAFYYAGNEAKDPGPWAYDSLKMSPNIDRRGPDNGILLAYNAKKWFVKGLYEKRFHKPHDLAHNLMLHITNSKLGRNNTYVNYPLYIDSESALFKAGYNSAHFEIQSRLVLSDNKDYLFLQPFGREVPVSMKYHQFALQGKYNYGNWQFSSRYIFDNKSLHKRERLHFFI